MHLYKSHLPDDKARNGQPQKRRPLLNSGGVGWDCVRQMQMFRRCPDVLASALRDMGVSENGDEIVDLTE